MSVYVCIFSLFGCVIFVDALSAVLIYTSNFTMAILSKCVFIFALLLNCLFEILLNRFRRFVCALNECLAKD